jgi:hypothetical protein
VIQITSDLCTLHVEWNYFAAFIAATRELRLKALSNARLRLLKFFLPFRDFVRGRIHSRSTAPGCLCDVEDFAVEVAKVGAHACQAGGSARQANLQPKKQRTISGPAGSLR